MFGSTLFAAGEAKLVIYGAIFVLALVILTIRLLVRLVSHLASGSRAVQEDHHG
jgi:hypothetical protein